MLDNLISHALNADLHNFGRSVFLEGQWVNKPRNVYWEQCFLGDSSVRQFIEQSFDKEYHPFKIIPKLQFKELTSTSGTEEFYKPVNNVVGNISDSESWLIGSSLALWSFFGAGDLHWENIIYGRDENNNLVLFPVDLEVFGREIKLPSHTWLIEDVTIPYNYCGFYNFLSSISNKLSPIYLVDGYINSLKKLNDISSKLCRILSRENNRRPFISRLIFRKTMSYQSYLNNVSDPKDFQIPLFNEEKLQLDRGDIPYFYKYLNGDPTIYVYNQDMQAIVTKLHENSDYKKLVLHSGFNINESANFLGQHIRSLLELGSLQLAKNSLLWLGKESYEADLSGLLIRLDSKQLFLKTKEFSYCTQI